MTEKALVPRRAVGKPGPAMSKLNGRQQEFVKAYLANPTATNELLARAAGYSGSPETLRVTGHRLAHDENVIAAIKEEAHKRLNSGAILAVSVLTEIMKDPLHRDRFKAATSVLERTGFHAKTEHTVNVNRNDMSKQELIGGIMALAHELGIDPGKLLGRGALEGEFEEVPALPAPEEPDGMEGLEDLF